MVVNYLMGGRNWTQVLWKNSQLLLTIAPFFQPLVVVVVVFIIIF